MELPRSCQEFTICANRPTMGSICSSLEPSLEPVLSPVSELGGWVSGPGAAVEAECQCSEQRRAANSLDYGLRMES